jgi:hypothetical protein
MDQFQRTQSQIDEKFATQRRGTVMMAVGWTLLGMSFLLGIYTFSAIREGTPSWLWYESVIGVLGLVLIAIGMMRRKS